MSGYWSPAMLNQAMQTAGNPYTPQADINSTLAAFGNNFDTARALLAASIPPPSGAFITNNPPPTTVVKTTSKITLPDSYIRGKRSKKDQSPASLEKASFGSDSSTASQGVNTLPSLSQATGNHRYNTDTSGGSTVNLLPTSTQPQIPTFDVLSKTDFQVPEETTPVFSTEIGMGKEYPVAKEQPTQSILLEPTNTRNKLFPHGAFRILHDNDHWHKFIISGPVADNKEKILKRILELSDPTLLLPVMYQEEGDAAVFYARNCGSAIDRLCRNNHLIFEIDGQKYILRILLQCAPVNRLKLNALGILRKVLEKRFNSSDRCLDLSNFEHDPDLASTLYCPLSQPSLLHYVLTTAINIPINFYTLRLSYNGIRILKIDVLFKASYLRTLDLSHNELLYQKDVKDLKELGQVTRLILDGNPLCADFRTPEEYINKMKLLMPQLKSLDSASLFPGSISVPRVKNFLCSKEGHQMVDQFLKHFFDRYDWKDRRCLDGLYHNNALFSLTCVHLAGQSTSDGCSLTWYTTYNHNLAKLSDYSKVEKNMYHGPDEILELFSCLPPTEHDPYSFSVDLVHYNDIAAVISVSGIFREQPSLPPEPDQMRSFRRVFVLRCTAPNEWQITNEQLHLSNPTTEQAEASFKIRRPPVEAPVAAWLVQDAQLLSDTEKEQMACIMTQLTTLNKEWATRFLIESHWYVREALISFVNKFEAKALPEDAFTKDQ
ncbi:nuclear RNA export factor 2-like [Thrips palmi]|uniref:Nuclear RNA export factor 2-like n=1 Tax=Thrips palmi TaxID=161013 RepID=A0A6P8Y8N3_THRPL|nr:nuclear RNA export factor 2-like [Thrips palmi]